MAKQYDDNQAARKLLHATGAADESLAGQVGKADLKSWNGSIDLTPFKRTEAWPGSGSFCLLGNSFDVAVQSCESEAYKNRASSIRSMLSKGKNSLGFIGIKDALADDEFKGTLSRFERDWLGRMKEDTILGPAYDERGELIEIAFSVWRHDLVPHTKLLSEH
ncbi:MAG: hypothetical protein C5B53_12205 [Candidatus Melainabacteria bacterium]|nr:MAG: hypothetical protein C5B53_12205 [Candidatus Melainabacteria bacterium]